VSGGWLTTANYDFQMVYEVKDSNSVLITLHIKGDVLPKGIKFFTGADMPIQVAQMSHPGGHLIRPHLHNKRETVITSTSEVLVVKSGKLKASFYSNEKIFIESRVLEENDIAVIVSGGPEGYEISRSVQHTYL
jgi:hypothetical protein